MPSQTTQLKLLQTILCFQLCCRERTPVHFQKGTCQVPAEQIGSAWPLETAVRGRAHKGVSGWIPLVSANDKSVKISIVPIQVQMLERNSPSVSLDFKQLQRVCLRGSF